MSAETDVSDKELEVFAGAGNYLEHWKEHRQGKTRLAGFNCWASIFGIQWWVFRKMYVYGALTMLADIGLPLITITLLNLFVALVGQTDAGHLVFSAGVCAFFLSRILAGYAANLVYLRHAQAKIRKIDENNLSNEMHLLVIKQSGGSSVGSVLVFAGIVALVRFFVLMLQAI